MIQGSRNSSRARNASILPPLAYGTVLLCCVATVVYVFTRPLPEIPKPGFPHPPSVKSEQESFARHNFFDHSVQPKIAAAETANREAVARCVKRIDELFDKYTAGVKPFTDDIMSFGSRWQTVKNMSWDWWNEENSSAKFVAGKIEEHLLSEKKLTDDLNEIMGAFRDDIKANEAKLLSEIRASVSSSSVSEVVLPEYSQFASQVALSLNKSAADSANSSVQNGIVTLIVSEVGTIAAQQLIAQLIVKIGATAVSTGAVGGTAMAGGAAAGGGTGAFGGPLGAAIGAGVGLVAGVVIDYFMSKSFKSKLTAQMTGYLQNLKTGLLDGDSKNAGLADDLSRVCDSLTETYRSNLFNSIVSSGAN